MNPEIPHGTRKHYQKGCTCLPCRAANATYQDQYRAAYRKGRPPLGAHIKGTEAHALIRALLTEHWTRGMIARQLGQRWPVLQYHDGVTLRTTLKLRILVRQATA
jgi:hypothetical protein